MDEEPQSDLVVIEDGAGTLIVGHEAALEAVLTEWSEQGELVSRGTVVAPQQVRHLAGLVGVAGDQVGRYVRTNKPGVPKAGELRWLTRGTNGQFTSNKLVTGTTGPAAVAGPAGLAAIATQIALDAAVAEITQAVADVQDTADEILRLASAERAGDVYGRRRLLQRMHGELRAGGTLTDTDWSSVAGMGPDLEVGVEALRQYAALLVTELADRRSADDRADALEKLNNSSRLGSVLRLLATAEQSFYLWQMIRIRRVETVESDYLEQTVTSARAAVAEHYRLDRELSEAARGHLAAYARLSVREFHRTISGRKLQREVAPLQAQLDEFATARGLQSVEWEAITNPGVRDALSAAWRRGDDVVGSGVSAVGKAGGAVERWASRHKGGSTEE